MPTVYPAAIDAFVNPTSVDTLDNPPHDGLHTDKNDAIEAVETELGINPRGAAASVRARLDALPLGSLGYAFDTTNQSGFTAEADITGLSVAVTVGAGRRIRISCQGILSSTVTTDLGRINIKEGATTLVEANVTCFSFETLNSSVILSPSEGAHTYKLTALRAIGTGSMTVHGSTIAPTFILVEDLGPAA